MPTLPHHFKNFFILCSMSFFLVPLLPALAFLDLWRELTAYLVLFLRNMYLKELLLLRLLQLLKNELDIILRPSYLYNLASTSSQLRIEVNTCTSSLKWEGLVKNKRQCLGKGSSAPSSTPSDVEAIAECSERAVLPTLCYWLQEDKGASAFMAGSTSWGCETSNCVCEQAAARGTHVTSLGHMVK